MLPYKPLYLTNVQAKVMHIICILIVGPLCAELGGLRNSSVKGKEALHVISIANNRYSARTAFLFGTQEPENPAHDGSHALSPAWPTEPVWFCGENESLFLVCSLPGSCLLELVERLVISETNHREFQLRSKS